MKYVMNENAISTAGPATHPSCAMAHANDSTPDPITAVMMCALAVINVPSLLQVYHKLLASGCEFRLKKNKERNMCGGGGCGKPVLSRPSLSKFLLASPFSSASVVGSMYMEFFSNSSPIFMLFLRERERERVIFRERLSSEKWFGGDIEG